MLTLYTDINRAAPSMSTQSANTDASQSGPDRLETRILVINATPGSPASTSTNSSAVPSKSGGGQIRGGYVGLMNCVFAAQKAVSFLNQRRKVPSLTGLDTQKVPIDVLTLPPPSSGTSPPIFLQQAAHLTEGIYWRWSGRGGLLQYLHVRYSPKYTPRDSKGNTRLKRIIC
jgi:transcription initiation factor TFIIH subunit 3